MCPLLTQQKQLLQCASKTKKCSVSRPTLKERDQDRTNSRSRPRGQVRDQDRTKLVLRPVPRPRPISRPTSLMLTSYSTISHKKHFVNFSDFESINNSIVTLKSLKYFSETVLLLLFGATARHAFTQARGFRNA